MSNDREPGRTFAPEDIGWIDFESRNKIDDVKVGTYRYVLNAEAIICAYAIGDGDPRYVAVPDFSPINALEWADMPADFKAHHERVVAGEAKWCAWNHSFDKAIWNYSTTGFPVLEPEHMIDAMTQATMRGLPPDLKTAARFSGSTPKVEEGRNLIHLFCTPKAEGTPQSHPEEWARFCDYALGDIVSMRDVFNATLQVPLAEWREMWAMEAINERGISIDIPMVKHATWLAHEDRRQSSAALARLTDGRIGTVDQVAQLTKWLLEHLTPEGRDILVKREEEIDEDGNITKPAKYSLTRQKVERLIAYVAAKCPELTEVSKVLQIRLYGGSKAPAKFARMMQQNVDGKLYGQYIFSGAPQTGRASSRGVQIHNLTRSFLPYEHDAIEAVLASCDYDALARLGDDSPVSRKLSLLVRPAFVPEGNNMFVWSDWSNIEARALPWLADYIPGAAARVQMFRDIDADPSLPDLYTRSAAAILDIPISAVTKATRQTGKVAELALGFLGSVGSLHNMAAALGLHFDDDEAAAIVKAWREANPWAMRFGQEMWDAMMTAWAVPGEEMYVGRCMFTYHEGNMYMQLPSKRLITYRRIKYEQIPVKDDDDNIIEYREELTYGRGHGRAKLWKGILVENATQGCAADVLRGTLKRLVDDGFDVVGHTHDEIVCEVNEQNTEAFAEALRWQMRRGFDWSDGLPLMSEETASPYYTKWSEAK